ncbi:hypothetical protein PV939_10695 [Ligilactobacillus salivarius]|nr:hypothetical protein [Ligilactobacillus salivarius]
MQLGGWVVFLCLVGGGGGGRSKTIAELGFNRLDDKSPSETGRASCGERV